MAPYLKRLVSALGAYQLADLAAKVMGILLLPVYTSYIEPAGYGIVETLATAVIFISIVVRFGMIEAFLRFYFADEDPERRAALARRAGLFLAATSTAAALALVAPARPISQLLLQHPHPTDYRIAVVGLWAFTNLELAYALLRVDERLRAYAVASLTNVALTIAGSLVFVVGLHLHAEGLLLGNYGATVAVLLGLWWTQRSKLRGPGGVALAEPLRLLLRFGLPTVPAEASVYGLSVIDRQFLVHQRGLAAAGLYSIAIKFAGAVAFIARAFQYAWPPLAYSVTDDREAGRLYGLVTTYYVAVSGWVVAGLTLESRWILRLLAQPAFFGAYRAVPWLSLGWALYGLWVVFLVIAGRAQVTRRNFPAALAGLVTNLVLVAVLVPRFGIAGAGAALCGAYVSMLVIMYLLVRRVFVVLFEWRRIAHLALVVGGFAVGGDLILPVSGFGGFVARAAVLLAIPPVLLATGFAHDQELSRGHELLNRIRTPGAKRS